VVTPAEKHQRLQLQLYYTGLYEFEDLRHPEGGTVTYKDINNVTQTDTGLYANECRLITALSITSVRYAAPC
jgi:hypothetical protein